MKKDTIAIVGGGASGMMAAICAAQKGAEVCIYEKNDRIGKKILATGNGKCNFTNLFLDDSCYRGGGKSKVKEILTKFSTQDCIYFFQSLGMLTKEKNGYLYPASQQASTVLDVLRMRLSFLGVKVVTDCEITKLQAKEGGYMLSAFHEGKREEYWANRVIVSAGSFAGVMSKKPVKGTEGPYRLLTDLKLPLVKVVPSLVQLRCQETYMKTVAGVRLDGEVVLYIDGREFCKERGEVQLTDYGVSGIPVFQLSRYAAYALSEKKSVTVHLNSLPDFTGEEYQRFQTARRIQNKRQTAEEYFLGICNKKLMLLCLKLSGIKPEEKISTVSEEKRKHMFSLLQDLPLTVVAVNPFGQAQVCAGGLSMEAVDEHLQVYKLPGLYVTGELLDVDGRCGGYNLQWAFASGYVAGSHASEQK